MSTIQEEEKMRLTMQRRPSTQDLSWLVDLYRNSQLDLDPPYQRRSVWTRGDKQYFLDTLFRNYPSPPIFLHKTISDSGKPTYHVVDGKQRTQTILDFIEDRLSMSQSYGDIRLDGKKWSQLQGEQSLKREFWNYQITVEMIDVLDGTVVNTVFERLNRNVRKLTRQELRHAKFDGWFISQAEKEASDRKEWRNLGIVTTSRAKRMLDVQFISELMLVILERKLFGFKQDAIDTFYAKYDDPSRIVPELDIDDFDRRFSKIRSHLIAVDSHGVVSKYARGFGDFYTLWALVALADALPEPNILAMKYEDFMKKVALLGQQQDLEEFLKGENGKYKLPFSYYNNSRGASTDLNPRSERLNSLKASILMD